MNNESLVTILTLTGVMIPLLSIAKSDGLYFRWGAILIGAAYCFAGDAPLWVLSLRFAGFLLLAIIVSWFFAKTFTYLAWKRATYGTEDEGKPVPADTSFLYIAKFILKG